MRLATVFDTRAFSRALSVRAACADCMALDVFGRDATFGDDGFNGRGGGARSGSELSHLMLVVSDVWRIGVYNNANPYIGTIAFP